MHVTVVLKSGSLNLLEPSGHVKSCNGIALPLPLPEYYTKHVRKQNATFIMLKPAVNRVIAMFVVAICHSTKFSLHKPVYDPRVENVVY
jgi:hypothetical protein